MKCSGPFAGTGSNEIQEKRVWGSQERTEVVFLRRAEADLLAAWMRYEEILPGLGERLEVEVRAALFRTVELPESAPIYAGEFRRLLMRRFDHGIFYCIHGAAS
jgi:hypothetical protein